MNSLYKPKSIIIIDNSFDYPGYSNSLDACGHNIDEEREDHKFAFFLEDCPSWLLNKLNDYKAGVVSKNFN